MTASFVDVEIEPGDLEPDGLTLRFKCASPVRAVTRVKYESDSGLDGWWRVRQGARTALVDDSGEGTSRLIAGGAQGLELEHEASGTVERVAYLLLAELTPYE